MPSCGNARAISARAAAARRAPRRAAGPRGELRMAAVGRTAPAGPAGYQEARRDDQMQRDDRDHDERCDLSADASRCKKPDSFMISCRQRPPLHCQLLQSHRFNSWREHVAAGAHRLDHGGIRRIGLDLAADAADQHVDRALERAGAAALREVEQAVARQHAAGPLAERPQQVELGAGHRDARAFRIAQFAQAEIDPPAPEGQRGCALDGLAVWAAVCRRSTALMRASNSRGLNGFGR